MKNIIIFITFILLIGLFSRDVQASEIYEDIQSTIDIEGFENVDTLLQNEDIDGLSITNIFEKVIIGDYEDFSFRNIYKDIVSYIKKDINKHIRLFSNIILIVILQGVLGNISSSFKSKGVSKIGSYVIYIAFITSIIQVIKETVILTSSYLTFGSEFTLALMPIYASILAINLKVTTATVVAPIILALSKIIIYLYSHILVNLIYIFAVINLINLITEKNILSNYIKVAVKGIKGVIKYSTRGYILLMSLVGIGTPIANNIALKTGKYVVKGIPVIGNTLGSAMDSMTLVGDVSKRGFVFAVIIISVVILLNYVVKIFITNMVLYISSIVISPVAESNTINALNTCSIFFEMLISICVSASIMITYSVLILLFV